MYRGLTEFTEFIEIVNENRKNSIKANVYLPHNTKSVCNDIEFQDVFVC